MLPLNSSTRENNTQSLHRLLYLIGQLRAGGQEHQLYNLLKAIDRKRYHPAVAVWSFNEDHEYTPRIRELGVPIYPLGPTGNILGKLHALWRLVENLKPEVVHSYCFWTNFAAYWATLGKTALAFGSVRGDFHQERKTFGPCFGRIDSYWPRNQIFNSFAAADNARSTNSVFIPRQIYVVCNGLDLNRFQFSPLPDLSTAIIVGAGTLESYKRWDRLVVAAAELRRRNLNFQIRIAGDGPLRTALNRQAQSLGVTDRVEFIGHNINVPKLLSDSAFLAHTSDTEGCPNIVMEAMACGRAVVATDVGDVRSLVDDGKTGFIVRSGDDTGFIEKLAIMITDQALCRRMGESGRARAERQFGLDRLVRGTLDAYRAAGWSDA